MENGVSLLSRLPHLFFLPAGSGTNELVSQRLWVWGSDPPAQALTKLGEEEHTKSIGKGKK